MGRYLSESRIRTELGQRGYPMGHEHFKRYRDDWGLIPERVEGRGYPDTAIEQIITVRQLGNDGYTLAPRVVVLYDHPDFNIPTEKVLAAMYEVVRGIEQVDDKMHAVHAAALQDEAAQIAVYLSSPVALPPPKAADADAVLPMLFPVQGSASLLQGGWLAGIAGMHLNAWYEQAHRLESALPELPFDELVTLLVLRNLHIMMRQMATMAGEAALWLWQKAAGLIEKVKPIRKQRKSENRGGETRAAEQPAPAPSIEMVG